MNSNNRVSHFSFLKTWPSLTAIGHSHSIPTPIDNLFNIPVYNNKTKTFFHKLNSTLECLAPYTNNTGYSILEILSFPTTFKWNTSCPACEKCFDVYTELIHFYETSIMRRNAEENGPRTIRLTHYNYRFAVCLDIQNTLNRTQGAWFDIFGCYKVNNSMPGSILPLIVCLFVLILFHVLSYSVCRRPIHVQIYRPKRVEPRIPTHQRLINTSSAGRENVSFIHSYGSFESSSCLQGGPVEQNESNRRIVL